MQHRGWAGAVGGGCGHMGTPIPALTGGAGPRGSGELPGGRPSSARVLRSSGTERRWSQMGRWRCLPQRDFPVPALKGQQECKGDSLGSSQGRSPSPGAGKPRAQRGGAQAPSAGVPAPCLSRVGGEGQRPRPSSCPQGRQQLGPGAGRAMGFWDSTPALRPRAHLRLQQRLRDQK